MGDVRRVAAKAIIPLLLVGLVPGPVGAPELPRAARLGPAVVSGSLDALDAPGAAGALAVAPPADMADPAAVYCSDMGYTHDVVEQPDGQHGVCTMPNGVVCDAWEFLTGDCGRSFSFCARQGYGTVTREDGLDPYSPRYAVCVAADGTALGTVTELSGLEDRLSGCGAASPWATVPQAEASSSPALAPARGRSASGVAAPPSFDWRNVEGVDWLTSVKYQGQCGSCWAFAALGVVEAAHNVASGNPDLDLDLAEEYLVSDCHSYRNLQNCCSGWLHIALQLVRDQGVPDEACMPYVDAVDCSCEGESCGSTCTYRSAGSCSDTTCSQRCSDWRGRLTEIMATGFFEGPTRPAIKEALLTYGPLAAAMGISSAVGGHWIDPARTVYGCDDDWNTNHFVVIVGYDDYDNYWIAKNSWGTSWGDGGYFKIPYGECGIERYVYYADARSPIITPTATPTSTLTPTATATPSPAYTATPVPTYMPTGTPTATVPPATPQGSILGGAWVDGNRNGQMEFREPGLPGAAIAVRTTSSGLVAAGTTSASGAFAFDGLEAGDYLVEETNPPGYLSSTSDVVQVAVLAGEVAWARFGDYWSPEVYVPMLMRP